MGRKKKTTTTQLVKQSEVELVQQEYVNELASNPEYSIEPDPTGQLNFSQIEIDFVRHYVNFKNVGAAAELACIDADTAKMIFVKYDVQQEIRRINRALYHRQFASKLVSVDEIGGYLSSLLTGENLPIADQLKTTEKLRVIELLLRLNELKHDGLNNPDKLLYKDFEVQVKNLSIKTIQQLLIQNNTVVVNDKKDAVSKLDDGNLSIEEKAYLSTLPVNELLRLIEETNKGGQDK